jgi:hypothetical protein
MIRLKQLIESTKPIQRPSIMQHNANMRKNWIPMWKTEYDSDLQRINLLVAINYMYEIAQINGFSPDEVEFANESKNPTNHFQLRMYLPNFIIWTSPFIYVDDSHRIVAGRTSIEILDDEYELIKKIL